MAWLDRVATDPEYITDRDVVIAFAAFWLGQIIMGACWIAFG